MRGHDGLSASAEKGNPFLRLLLRLPGPRLLFYRVMETFGDSTHGHHALGEEKSWKASSEIRHRSG
jgi:hypothetical protein